MDSVPIYCINLESRPDRWERIIQRLSEHGLSAVRWNASTPTSCTVPCRPHLSPKERACSESHFLLWKHIVETEVPYSLILEDDAVFRKDWIPITNAKLKETGWDALFLNLSEPTFPLNEWVRSPGFCMAGAYIITNSTAKWLVDRFSTCIDIADGMTIQLQENLVCHTYFPWLVIQEGRDSNIQTNEHLSIVNHHIQRLLAMVNCPLSFYGF